MVIPMQTLRHVVTGTDFSAGAEAALSLALSLAAAAGVPLTVVHVCQLDDGPEDERLEDERLEQCGEALAALVGRLRDTGIEVRGVLRIGDAAKKLANVATEVGAGLIVVGRAGAGRSAALGSVAERLVRSASRPVLTVS